MSRGPGRWQRLIFATLTDHEAFYLVDLLPADYSRAQYTALYRAVVRLEETGQIHLAIYRAGAKKVAISREPIVISPDGFIRRPERCQLDALSAELVGNPRHFNPYPAGSKR
jgi:hypothetical protein